MATDAPVSTLIVHGDADQIVPNAGRFCARVGNLVEDATLKVYKGAPRGLAGRHLSGGAEGFPTSSAPDGTVTIVCHRSEMVGFQWILDHLAPDRFHLSGASAARGAG